MKKFKNALVIVVVVTIFIGFGLLLTPKTTTYNAPQGPVTVEKEIVVPEVNKLIEEAQKEAQERVETEAQEAYDYAYEQAMLGIATEVRDEYIAELNTINQADKDKLQAY